MSEQLVGIPVEVVSASGQDLESANMALPILNEIAAMLEAGVYLAPSPFEAGFVSLAHRRREIGQTLRAAGVAMKRAARVR